MRTLNAKIIYGVIWILTIGSLFFESGPWRQSMNGMFFMISICALLYLFSGLILDHEKENVTIKDVKSYFLKEKYVTVVSLIFAIYFFYLALTE